MPSRGRSGSNFHEDLGRKEETRASSDRAFGAVFTVAALAFGLWPLKSGGDVRIPALGAGAAIAAIAVVRPSWLHPFNRAWTSLGLLIGRVVNPVVTSVLFFLVITPFGWAMRLLNKDPLRLRRDASLDSYWIPRDPARPAAESFPRQF